jgi:hypothetical protein
MSETLSFGKLAVDIVASPEATRNRLACETAFSLAVLGVSTDHSELRPAKPHETTFSCDSGMVDRGRHTLSVPGASLETELLIIQTTIPPNPNCGHESGYIN